MVRSPRDVASTLWMGASLLRGAVDSRRYAEFLLPLVTLRVLDVLCGERLARDARWSHLKNVAPSVVSASVMKAMARVDAMDGHLGELFGEVPYSQLGDQLVRRLIELVDATDEFELTTGSFEYLIQAFADSQGRSGGEFYTPHAVAELLVRLASPRNGMEVLDPCAGTCSLLLHAAAIVSQAAPEGRLTLFGQEINRTAWHLGRQHCFVAGVDADIRLGNSLLNPQYRSVDGRRREFDVVITSPPFNVEVGSPADDHSFPYGITRKSDLLFLQHAALSLKAGGVGVVQLSPGALFRSGAEQDIRRVLVEKDLVEAVIALGPGLLYGTGIASCLVIVRGHGRKAFDRKGKLLFVDASELVSVKRGRNEITAEHVDQIVGTYQRFVDIPGFARVVASKEVLAADASLAVRQYVNTGRDRYLDELRQRYSDAAALSTLGDLVLIESARHSQDDAPNALYMSTAGSFRVTSEAPTSQRKTSWLALRPKGSDVSLEYLRRFLQSELGRRGLELIHSRSLAATINRSALADLVVPIPDIVTQQRMVAAQQRLEEHEALLSELRHKALMEPASLPAIEEQLRVLGNDDSLDNWIATLPYPLATVLRRYQGSVDPREKASYGIRFFEAFAQFLAMVDLSCILEATRTTNRLAPLGTLIPDFDRTRVMHAAGIGVWSFVHRKVAELMQGDTVREALSYTVGRSILDVVERLRNEELHKVLFRATKLKNNFKSHDAVADDVAYQNQLLALEQELITLRKLLVGAFSSIQLIQPIPFGTNVEAGVRYVKANVLRGSDPAFNQSIVRSDRELDSSKLYLFAVGDAKPLPLVPLVRMERRPKYARDACYFFSKIEGSVRWVSYHFEQEPTIEDDGAELRGVFDELFPVA